MTKRYMFSGQNPQVVISRSHANVSISSTHLQTSLNSVRETRNKTTKILFSAAGGFILVRNSSLWKTDTGKTQEDISPEAAGGDE